MPEKRLEVVAARFTAQERKDLVYAAQIADQTITDLIRDCVIPVVRQRIQRRLEQAGAR
ncbi:MAG: hypothetical protein ACF8Q5_01245 [Phycisphaerales bacterium JB040]